MNAVEGGHVTLHQPGFKTASDKETVLTTGLTSMNFLPSELAYAIVAAVIADSTESVAGSAVTGDLHIPAAALADFLGSHLTDLILTEASASPYIVTEASQPTAVGDLKIEVADLPDLLTEPTAVLYARCSNPSATIANGINSAVSGSGAYAGWKMFKEFDPAYGIQVTIAN
jgi:hypothetical protein